MIDLIIPYYNNPEGLNQTLKSINKNIFYITVIDDNSSIYMPYDNAADQVFRYNMNRGPGFARQLGIDKTNNEYIMFIDTGDIFLSQEIQNEIVQAITSNLDTDVISFPYYYKNKMKSSLCNSMI